MSKRRVRIELSRIMLHIVPEGGADEGLERNLANQFNRYTQGEYLLWNAEKQGFNDNPDSDGRESGILQGAHADPDGDGNISVEVFLAEGTQEPAVAQIKAALAAWLQTYDLELEVTHG